MHRTQIYLDPEQARRLDELAAAGGTTRSHIVREAVGVYLSTAASASQRVERLQETVRGFAAHPLDLPPGREYVARLREADRRRSAGLERRRG